MTIQDPFTIAVDELKALVKGFAIEGAKARFSTTATGITVSFSAAESSCTLSTEIRETTFMVSYTDAEGNDYVPCVVRVRVNYPSHISMNPSVVLERSKLITEVALLGQAVEEHFKGRDLISLHTTAQMKAQRAATQAQESTKSACILYTKGMRVNQTKVLNKAQKPLENVKEGEFEDKGKSYTVKIHLDGVFLTRTK